MDRMKTFLKYLILFLLLYAFVSFMSYELAKSTLIPMENYNIAFKNPDVTIEYAKASKVNGYVNGIIKNNTNDTIYNKYIKVDLISDSGTIITSRYITIEELKPNEEQKFEVEFHAESIRTFNMDLVDNKETSNLNISKSEVIGIIGGVLLIWLIFAK